MQMEVSDVKDGLHISMTRKMISATHSGYGNITMNKEIVSASSGTIKKMAN